MLLTNEVQDQARNLPLVMAQAAAELLKKESRTLGGPQQNERVDEREINTLVVEVAREQNVDVLSPVNEMRHGRVLRCLSLRGRRGRGCRLDVKQVAMNFACSTLTQKPSARTLLTSATRRASCDNHERRPCVVARVEIGKSSLVVPGSRPADSPKIRSI